MSTPDNQPWIILTSRYGGDARNPATEQVAKAVREIFHEDTPSMLEADYAEHPNAWIRYGFDEGPMYVIDIGRGGTIRFEQWADPDFEDELEAPLTMANATEQDALRLLTMLTKGQIDQIKAEKWNAI
jgi:hypothetical protein